MPKIVKCLRYTTGSLFPISSFLGEDGSDGTIVDLQGWWTGSDIPESTGSWWLLGEVFPKAEGWDLFLPLYSCLCFTSVVCLFDCTVLLILWFCEPPWKYPIERLGIICSFDESRTMYLTV